MPGLRYGYDITDDAAQVLDTLSRAQARMADATISDEERRKAKQLVQDARDRIRTTFGNMRTAKMFADLKGEFGEAGTATGPNGKEVNARDALTKSAHAAYRRLQKQGRVPEIVKTPQEDGRTAYKYGATRADRSGATGASRRLVARSEEIRDQTRLAAIPYKAARQVAARGGTMSEVSEAVDKARKASAAGAARKQKSRAAKAAKKAAAPAKKAAKKAAKPRRPRGGGQA